MRVHSIELINFLAFTGDVPIDFDEVSQEGLFMLYGLTGSGKTTILDGICFALYGRSPRIDKTKGLHNLRSQYAAEDQATKVILEFSVAGVKYKVTRTLAQKREQGADVKAACVVDVLKVSSWENIHHSTRDSNQFLANLIGLTADQFFQIVLLPQGKFREFLDAKTAEKEEILKRLFAADRLKVIENWFKDQASKAKAAKDTADVNLRLAAGQIDPSLNDADVKISIFKPKWVKDFQKDLSEKLEQSRKQLSEAKKAFDAAEKSLQTFETLREKFEKQKTAQSDLLAAQKQIDELISLLQSHGLDVSADTSELAVSISHQISADLARINQIDEELAANVRFRELTDSINAARSVVEAEEKKAASAKTEIEQLEESRNPLKQLLDQAALAGQNVAQATSAEIAAKSNLDLALTLQSHQAASEKLAKSIAELTRDVEAKSNAHDLLKEKRDRSLAAELALSLEPGNPCAVCGGTEHPAPAHTSEEFVSKEVLEVAAQAESSARTSLATEQQKLQSVTDQIAEIMAQLGDSAGLQIEQLASVHNELSEAKRSLDAEISAGADASIELTVIDSKIRTAKEAADSAVSAIQKAQVEMARLEAAKSQLLLNPNEEALVAERESLQMRVDSANSGEWVSKVGTSVQNLALTQQLLKELGDLVEFDSDAFSVAKKEFEEKDARRVSASAEVTALEEKATSLQSQADLFLERLDVYEKANVDHREISGLYRQISGNSGSKEIKKVSLQAYYLAARLDEVLLLANQRLSTMTADRFSMMRNPNSGVGSQNHLDIWVLDAWTGKTRPSATGVSGGESFLMSMALALGLADAIVGGAGIQPFESLFIDEGFGTLDPETLDVVMDTLFDLQAGARVVGVISHVKEMAERIPRQIYVKKLAGGSKVELRTFEPV